MNYLCHALSAQHLDSLGIVGSALPDIRHHGFNHLHRHRRAAEFLRFAEERFPEEASLAYGALNHALLDGIAGRRYGFFAAARAEVAAALKAQGVSILYADMLTDIGLDMLIVRDRPDIGDRVRAAWEEASLGTVAWALAGFFGEEAARVGSTLAAYGQMLPSFFESYRTPEGCAGAAAMRIARLQRGRKAGWPEVQPEQLVEVFQDFRERNAATYSLPLTEAVEAARREQNTFGK